MIGLHYLHSREMTEACTEWQGSVKKLVLKETATKPYSYTLYYKKGKSKSFSYRTLQEKIYGVSSIILDSLVPHNSFWDVNHEVAHLILKEELDRVFTNIWSFVGYDCQQIKKEAERCANNKKRTYLYGYVYEAMKRPFEELYGYMQVQMQDPVFEKLNIRTCPYCNRQYTFTLIPKVTGDPFTSPEFDHFYPKSLYPTLAVCFYNLVPSCHCCNHGKGKKQLHINPYSSSFDGHFYVCDASKNVLDKNQLLNVKSEKDIQITYQGKKDEEEDIKALGLDKLYSMHSDYVEEIIDKVRAYNSAVNEGLIESFQGIYTSNREVYDFVWGRHLDDSEHEKRPLAKFTKDILEQVGVKRS